MNEEKDNKFQKAPAKEETGKTSLKVNPRLPGGVTAVTAYDSDGKVFTLKRNQTAEGDSSLMEAKDSQGRKLFTENK